MEDPSAQDAQAVEEDYKTMRKINIPVLLSILVALFLFGVSVWLGYLFITLLQKI